jgi:hypothetical protein
MEHHVIWNGTFHDRFQERKHAIAVYQRHNEEVMRVVPTDRLLVHDLSDGWEPMCKFLDVGIPENTPFPHLNTAGEFWHRINARRFRRVIGLGLAAAAFLTWLVLTGRC